eukprot:NODE_3854_length_736_cov_180.424376.p1 GENE.NODE_3854_length_736_cov_180.424376~~NODE_3854_length_736_cov_180.424376.p1  ORF type:complete len:187 (+),score=48.84 NODE_3854_length_736_cov_180.424376:28-561(+)
MFAQLHNRIDAAVSHLALVTEVCCCRKKTEDDMVSSVERAKLNLEKMLVQFNNVAEMDRDVRDSCKAFNDLPGIMVKDLLTEKQFLHDLHVQLFPPQEEPPVALPPALLAPVELPPAAPAAWPAADILAAANPLKLAGRRGRFLAGLERLLFGKKEQPENPATRSLPMGPMPAGTSG